MKKKAQMALEFLTTYGWALLMVLVAVGALSYFGVLSPSNYLDDRCVLGSPFVCQDFLVEEQGFRVFARNDLNEPALISSVSYSYGGMEEITCSGFEEVLARRNAVFELECVFEESFLTVNDVVSTSFTLSYSSASDPPDVIRVSVGDFVGVVQPSS